MKRISLPTWLLIACLSGSAWGADPAPDSAVDRGLRWLLASQQADGSWGSGSFSQSTAVTAHGLLALLGSGSTPASGPHAGAAGRAVTFLQNAGRPDGLIAAHEAAAHGPMYGHVYATLALAEAYGELPDEGLRERLVAAGELLARAQGVTGGWRYQPVPGDADISVTAAAVVALRGLDSAGIPVPARVFDRGIDYIAGLQNEDGGFRYRDEDGPSGGPRTAAALLALMLAGRRGETVERGFRWLDDHPLELGGRDGYALYGLVAAAAVRWQLRLETDDHRAWEAWFERTRSMLLAAQQSDGSWQDPSCPEYGTAAALAVLQTPDSLLPILTARGADGAAGSLPPEPQP